MANRYKKLTSKERKMQERARQALDLLRQRIAEEEGKGIRPGELFVGVDMGCSSYSHALTVTAHQMQGKSFGYVAFDELGDMPATFKSEKL